MDAEYGRASRGNAMGKGQGWSDQQCGGAWRGVPVLRWLVTTTEGVSRSTGMARQGGKGSCCYRVVSGARSAAWTGSAAAPFCEEETQKDPGFGVLTPSGSIQIAPL